MPNDTETPPARPQTERKFRTSRLAILWTNESYSGEEEPTFPTKLFCRADSIPPAIRKFADLLIQDGWTCDPSDFCNPADFGRCWPSIEEWSRHRSGGGIDAARGLLQKAGYSGRIIEGEVCVKPAKTGECFSAAGGEIPSKGKWKASYWEMVNIDGFQFNIMNFADVPAAENCFYSMWCCYGSIEPMHISHMILFDTLLPADPSVAVKPNCKSRSRKHERSLAK